MAKANPFRFSTKYQDDETDLLYHGYRYYNASTGRWLSRDPKGEEAFRRWAGREVLPKARSRPPRTLQGGVEYPFASNDPHNGVDVLGLRTLSFRFGGDAEIEVFNLAGLDAQLDTLKRVVLQCKCDDIAVDYDWFWRIGGWDLPDDDGEWNLFSRGTTDDDRRMGLILDNMGHDKIPVWLTGFPVFYDRQRVDGVGYQRPGVVINVSQDFWAFPNILAHELGHVAGYDGGDIDGKSHSSKHSNIMYPFAGLGGSPDDTYCKKVAALAK